MSDSVSNMNFLVEREAIIDVLYRAVMAFDNDDVSLLQATLGSQDVVFDLDGAVYEGFENIRTEILGCVGPMDTTHMISNIQVGYKDGASTASLTALALSQHCLPQKGKDQSSPKFSAGSRYFLDLLKDKSNGSWKIQKWVMKIIWTEGDRSIMQRYA